MHPRMLHAKVNAHEGTRLLKSMRDGSKVAMWPWEGVGIDRCWVTHLGTGPEGTTVFQLQPKRLPFNDRLSCGDDKPTCRCGAGIHREYTKRRQLSRNFDDIRCKRVLFLKRIGLLHFSSL